MIIEVCLDSLDSVAAAAEAGAHRIELCSALTEGGLTPTVGTLMEARRIFPGTIVHMIRPRRGDFHYSPSELAAMAIDIRQATDHGADELIFGCLRPDGTIDQTATESLIQACSGRPHVFHRAFDASHDLPASLETLIAMGFKRVLSSGGQPDALLGAPTLADLVKQSAGRIQILPGGGINLANAAEVARITQAGQLHLSGRRAHESPMLHRRPDLPMGATEVAGEYEFRTADAEILSQVIAIRENE